MTMLDEASVTVRRAADGALAETAGENTPPRQDELAAWIGSGECPPDVMAEVEARLEALWGLEHGKAKVTGFALGGLVTLRDGVEYLAPAGEILKDAEGRNLLNPLAPLVMAWLNPPIATEPGRHPRPIVPSAFAARQQAPIFHMPTPLTPGPVQGQPAYLLGLEPQAPPAPALLLAMFDSASGASLTQNGRVSNTASIWLEAMLDLPPERRDVSLRETAYTLREIACEWLGWDLRHYRKAGRKTGQALARALAEVRDLWVPMNNRGGGYFPVMVSAWTGLGLDDQVAFIVRVPGGHIGPQVDRGLLRSLRDSGPAYRTYLSLVFEWDKYGGHGGRLILPTRPEVRRAKGGQVLDAQGSILTGPGGIPVYTPHHPKAIRTGKREPNPARKRYPEYSPDDLVHLAFPGQVFTEKNRSVYRRRAIEAVGRLQRADLVVERLGTRFRIMPPDGL